MAENDSNGLLTDDHFGLCRCLGDGPWAMGDSQYFSCFILILGMYCLNHFSAILPVVLIFNYLNRQNDLQPMTSHLTLVK